jgi:hypothetical protein
VSILRSSDLIPACGSEETGDCWQLLLILIRHVPSFFPAVSAFCTRTDRICTQTNLFSTSGAATATGLSAMVEGEVIQNRITRFLSGQDFTSKDLWQQLKSIIRSVEISAGLQGLWGDRIEYQTNGVVCRGLLHPESRMAIRSAVA